MWNEEDEVTLLIGMVDFQAKHGGADPAVAFDDFYEFIRLTLHAEFSKTKIYKKVRRLKQKYMANLSRSMQGDDPASAKSHDRACYKLSKKIWGPDEPGGAAALRRPAQTPGF